MSQSRQLTAIMFADIVGYTAMMQEDESLALNLRNKFKKKLEQEVAAHHGNILELKGDGSLSIFTSTIEGVNAALALQLNMQTIPVVPVRIGIHTGDVIIEENNIYGDSVNIASRLESFAIPGSIFISGKGYDDIKNQHYIQTISLGNFALKNVKEQVEIFAISNPGIKVPSDKNLEGKGEKITNKKVLQKSIAVLPFVNMSNDPEQEYFSDGIAEEILNSLAHIKDLKVAGRTSSYQFKGKNIDLREVGDKLGVSTVLEGSVRKQGNHLRITAQLINVEDGFHIWSEKYDRELDDVFVIQDEIAITITEKLKITILDTEKAIIQKLITFNQEAYDYYLKGRFFWKKRGPGLKKGLQYFQLAVETDPLFALAHAGIADSYSLLAFYSVMAPHDAMPRAKKAALTAISIDESLVEAWTSLAFISLMYDWNWADAKKQFQKAISINPNYAAAHNWYSTFLTWIENKPEEGIHESKIATELEPLVAISYSLLANSLLGAEKYIEAMKASRTAIELEADSFLSYWFLGVSLIGLERYTEAIEVLKTSVHISARHAWPLAELCNAYSLTGENAEAQKLLDELISRSKTEFISGMFLFIAAYSLKHYDLAFEFLEKSFEQRDGTLAGCRAWPGFAQMKNDTRFLTMIKRMNFPE